VSAKTVVLGLGNALLKDEGIGVHVIHALQHNSIPEEVEIIDGGTSPDITYLIEDAHKLIVVDAARGGGEPGTIYRLGLDDITSQGELALSTHDISLFYSLRLMESLGNSPEETVIIGVEPKEIDLGLELSPELEQKVPSVIKVVLEEIECSSQSKSHWKRS
jgi:hydrogenase maturation protease